MNRNFIDNMPEMKSGRELISALTVLPEYDDSIRNENQAIRLMQLSDLYRMYIPSNMSLEIYSKLYLALLRSLQKKGTQAAVRQKYENYKRIQNQQMIEIEEPYTKIIPCVIVQCPFDSSVKGLLLEILRKVDEALETHYYQNALRARATTDMLIGSVSQVALNHIGMLIVDEIQNVVNSKNGKSLIGSLTQLINNSGISICMVGTPECTPFFEQALQLARRSVGLQYQNMPYDAYFESFCKILFDYQYTKERTEPNPAIYECILPFVSDEKKRAYIINEISIEKNISKQTIRNYLCLYLVYQNEAVFCPKQKEEKELTEDEKNMRWGLNKFFYNHNKNSLTTAYTLLLQAKYCDESGKVLSEHPSINQFRYEALETHYYQNALRARATTDMLIGSVSQVALNHIGMLIVDEIQNVVNSKNGKSLIGSLTQLINNSGISICMVGTPECTPFFEQALQLARRSVGLQYQNMPYDAYFESFCKILFDYQYTKERTEPNPAIYEWLYEHSAGILSIVVSLIHDAQEIAILSGKERLDMDTLNEAYSQRLSFLHGYIQPCITKNSQTLPKKPRNYLPIRLTDM